MTTLKKALMVIFSTAIFLACESDAPEPVDKSGQIEKEGEYTDQEFEDQIQHWLDEEKKEALKRRAITSQELTE